MKKHFFIFSVFLIVFCLSQPLMAKENGGELSIASPQPNEKLSKKADIQATWDIPEGLEGAAKVGITIYDNKGKELISQEIPVEVETEAAEHKVEFINLKENDQVSGTIKVRLKITPLDKGYAKVRIFSPCPGIPDRTFNLGEHYEEEWDTTQVENGRVCSLQGLLLNKDEAVVGGVGIVVTAKNEEAAEHKVEFINLKENDQVSGTIKVRLKITPLDKGYAKVRIFSPCPGIPDRTFNLGEHYEEEWDTTQVENGRVCSLQGLLLNKDEAVVGGVGIVVTAKNEVAKPTIEFIAPSKGETVSGYVTFRLDTKDVLMDTMEMPLPSGETFYFMKKFPYEYTWFSPDVADGEYMITVKATKDGKEAKAEIKVTVKNKQ